MKFIDNDQDRNDYGADCFGSLILVFKLEE